MKCGSTESASNQSKKIWLTHPGNTPLRTSIPSEKYLAYRPRIILGTYFPLLPMVVFFQNKHQKSSKLLK